MISNFLLLFLLIVRITDQYLPSIIFKQDAPIWFNDYYSFSLYVLIFLLIWINRDNLKSYNINVTSLNILVFGGIILTIQLSEVLLKVALLLIVSFFCWAKSQNLLRTHETTYYPTWVLIIFIFFIVLAWLPVLLYSVPTQSTAGSRAINLSTAFFQAYLPGVVFEEFLFRGFLWGYLSKIKVDERIILLIQAVLFWISHHRFLLLHNTYLFWLPLPIMALLLGWVVMKSKSLASSTIAHYLFNFTTSIVKQIYLL